jgi:hypothetical protein
MMATYPNIEIGDLVTADLLDSMLPQTYTKQTATSRLSTTAYAADPELTGIALEIGTYDIDFLGFFTADVNKLIDTQWSFSGTWANTVRNTYGPGATSTAQPGSLVQVSLRGWGTSNQDARYGIATASGAYVSISESVRGVAVSAAGSLAFQWKPTASTADNITLQPGSNFTVRRVG